MEEKIHLFGLAGLKQNNVREIFKRNFDRWRYLNSSEVIVNGEKIEGIERELMLLPDKKGNPNIKSCTVSDTTKNGFTLTEKTFIDEELKTYEPIYNKTVGSKTNREINLKLKVYIDFLKDRITKRKEALPPQQTETKTEQETPKTFEELFYNPEHAEPCLKILSELQPPVIDAINNYIGKAKGVFPLWVKVLKNHKPEPLIKHFKDAVYKDLLNQKVKGLNLSKDASEFRKQYKRVENDKIELDIKTILSQYSQSGKLGK